ncbi:MAG: alpha/beta hydrolase [Actinomycetota bacterium]
MTDTPTLLLLHGLGASGGVWHGVESAIDWPGRVVNAELAGHGASAWADDYSLGALAMAASQRLEPGEPTIAVGHSLGGGVALCLAAGFHRPDVRAVVGVGLKITWSEADVAGMATVAAKGVRHYDRREEAAERFLRQAGLVGLIDLDHPSTETGVVADGDRWRPAQDPATFAQRPVPMPALIAAARAADCPVILGAGEHDAMVSEADMAVHVSDPRIAVGRGHNVQVEDPAWILSLIDEATQRAR